LEEVFSVYVRDSSDPSLSKGSIKGSCPKSVIAVEALWMLEVAD
jgi:hypothetical protein